VTQEHDPVADALNAAGIPAAFRTFPEGTDTAEQAAAAAGCELNAIVKSLVFMAGDELILALVAGGNRLDEAKLASALESAHRVRKATAREVESRTGFKIGTVPPIGHRAPLRVVIDRELLNHREVWAASGVRHRIFPIAPVMLAAVAHGLITDIHQTTD